jgi:hypothetical protein
MQGCGEAVLGQGVAKLIAVGGTTAEAGAHQGAVAVAVDCFFAQEGRSVG